jgi:DNA-binding response OmpR family regulator
MRVLIAEDERVLADVVAVGLRKEAMAVDVVYDGDAALERAMTNDYDVIVLDRDLPRLHGDEVCRRLAAERVPARIIMLTAAGDLRSKVEGLSIGADDYLPKPFDFPELVARLRALARRARASVPPVLSRSGITLDPARHEVFRDGRYVGLSPKEFAVLEVLLRAEGAVVSAEDLLEKAWDENINYFTNSVRVTLGTLRKKLGRPPVIETVTGAGYRL